MKKAAYARRNHEGLGIAQGNVCRYRSIPLYLLEWVLLFVLIYYVFRILKENNAKYLIIVYAVLIVAVGIVMVLAPGSIPTPTSFTSCS